ncbi:alpha/beta fold hydrolase [Amycolatopsis sp. CA-230715]|uniref:alpha/beta fold hydrolase n=1 Tax=Amycolatopsis sp. CA-230715 TaxID=2745196 RepID=UPI001C00BA3E|nr:alpha/beta hydrolase [Amycolatopsis sp. CA-230715]QWF84982.1 2-succinyl-6-hydroxy-2,4-cyclohexadiene-1-carboxylate synthase [Amycolatopsis sp. CA-230715]
MAQLRLADGTALCVSEAGDPGAPVTVLFAHGYALDLRSWQAIVPDLVTAAERPVRVLTYDHRGHGRSDHATRSSATMNQLADDLAELVEKLVPDGKVVLVGHDMGGLAVMSLTQRHPRLFADRVGGLVLLGTSAGGFAAEASASWPQALGLLVRDLEAVLGSKIIGLVRERTSKAVSAGLRWWLFGDDPDPAAVELTVQMIKGNWPHTVSLFRPALDTYAREAALSVAADIPVTAIVGERDRLVPAEDVALLVRPVRRGTAVVLPGAGHVLPLEAPAQILPRIVGVVHSVQRELDDDAG